MDNQQLEKLETLYHCLLENQQLEKQQLAEKLNCSQDRLKELVSELCEMGLTISQDGGCIQLNHAVDVTDTIQLQHHLKQTGIDKPFHYRFSTASTNQWAQTDKTPSIYLSEHQSAGRGRQERHWLTPLGQSIAISIDHKFNLPLKDLTGLNIAIAVAIINTAKQCGVEDLSVKWPNDILKHGAKVAGILLQASGSNQNSQVTIGIGINWNLKQSLLDSITQACTNIACKTVTRTAFVAILITEIEKILIEFSSNKLKNIQSLWNQSDTFKNKQVNIIQGNKQYTAIYRGITQNGSLKVQVNDAIKTLVSGEVSMRKVD